MSKPLRHGRHVRSAPRHGFFAPRPSSHADDPLTEQAGQPVDRRLP
ncbi:hypothetical protein [Streptomyces sp. NTH33]|nr:hypothetical protein [Streptomyces sp. NTH33]